MMSKLFVVEKLEAWKEWKNGRLLWKIIEITNILQHMTIDSFLIIIFRFGLQPYLCVATIAMKKETLQ
jgi:hypothetical protein